MLIHYGSAENDIILHSFQKNQGAMVVQWRYIVLPRCNSLHNFFPLSLQHGITSGFKSYHCKESLGPKSMVYICNRCSPIPLHEILSDLLCSSW